MTTIWVPDDADLLKTYDIRLRQRGQITVPREVRDRLNIREGDVLTLVQVGSMLLLTPKRPVVPLLADQIAELMEAEGVTLADLLLGLEEERAALYKERWRQEDAPPDA
ncbi:MAG: AbrB/MazE/SpoVT family DNA-binding domain-containing protein [Chloroflexi bacterium]|nr:MAG: AbrB/MazE/SpoVT family DNA-binding domain-containing protein [Chloroflexota bacterium]